MSSLHNNFKILTCANKIKTKNINNFNIINRQLSSKPKLAGSLKEIFEKNQSNFQSIKEKTNKNRRKTQFNINSNNPSTGESSITNSLFEGLINFKKHMGYTSSKLQKCNSDFNIRNKELKPLIYYIPKNVKNKLIFDILFGHHYILSKNKHDIKKIENFILEMQIKFNKKISNLFIQEDENNDTNDIMLNSPRTKRENNKNDYPYSNDNSRSIKIEDKGQYFHKLEDLMALYSLIIFYFIKNKYLNKAKTIYLVIIKQNIKCLNYLEKLIDFNALLRSKNDKYIMRVFQTSVIILLKVYSFLIKYSFLLHLSYYGNMFMRKYMNLSYKFYLYSMSLHKLKNSMIENEIQVKFWFSILNYYSAYFSIANYLPMNIPISLCNVIINIINSIDDKYFDLKEKNLLLCTYYNKGLLLYVSGNNEEAINCLKETKKKIFMYIEDLLPDKQNKKLGLTYSVYGSPFADGIKKGRRKHKDKGIISFQKLFNSITKNAINLVTSNSNNSIFANNKKQLVNINKKFEPFFLSNDPFNIINFIKLYLQFYNIKIDGLEEEISAKSTYNKLKSRHNNSSFDRKSYIKLTNINKSLQKNTPNIFKNPILIRTELLLAEIEIDGKNYKSAYTYVNHALAIISLFRKLKNIFLLNKYNNEQKLINEFLNILDNNNIKNYSGISEREEYDEEEEEYDTFSKDEEYKKEYELKEKVKLNRKILTEIEKFFLFFSTLSAYQIKVLNDTQPNTEKRNYLPILFQNQFKDCLNIKQMVAVENLHVMSLSRNVILKDPDKLILPKNLNIFPVYFEKPELFTPRYSKVEKESEISEEKKRKDLIQKKAYKNFQAILKSKKSTLYIQNFLNSNYNLVMKILTESTPQEINKVIENPNILIKPVEKFKSKNHKKEKKRIDRYKSQICLPNKKIINQKISIINVNDLRMTLNNNRYIKNNLSGIKLKVSKSDNLDRRLFKNKTNRTKTSSNDNTNLFSFSRKNLYKQTNYNNSYYNIDTYSSYKLSINASID